MLRCLPLPVLVAAVVALAAVAAAADCPPHCECKWRGGKESAICRAAGLKALPKGLDAGTQLLDLTGNAIAALGRDAFSSAGLVNLQKVYLARCRLAAINRLAFRLLINLVELDLSFNELQVVPSAALESIAELRELRLSGNPIQRIEANAFSRVPQLVRLEMSECKVAAVEARAFVGLEKSLEWLKLDHNRLSTVRPEAFADMQSLHGLEVDGNPWNCTCALRAFRNWMLRKNVPSSVPAVCAAPGRLRGRAWDRLELDEFACGPRVEALRGAAQAVEGENVTLSCRVQGAPSPNVRWLFRNRVVVNLTQPAAVPFAARKLLYVRTAGNSSNLTIVALDAQDAGVYVCVADNRAGKVDASVTLSVSRRAAPADAPLSGKVVAASVLVALLFVLSTCLVALCLWSLRKRHSLWAERARGGARLARLRHDDANHYEKIEMMNHKPTAATPPQLRAVTATTNVNHAPPRRDAPPRPPRNPRSGADAELVPSVAVRRGGRKGRYRGVPSHDEDDDLDDVDEVGYDAEVEMTPTVSHGGGPWTSAHRRSSSDTLSSHHSDARAAAGHGRDPEAASSRRAAHGLHQDGVGGAAAGPTHEQGKASLLPLLPRNGLTSAAEARALSHHALRKKVLHDPGGSLYASMLGEDAVEDRSFPDLLQPQADSLPPSLGGSVGGDLGAASSAAAGLRAGLWGTLPRRPHHHRADRHGSRRGSESPLLAESRYGSSGGSSSSGLGLGAGLGSAYPLLHQRSSSSLNLAGSSPLVPQLPLPHGLGAVSGAAQRGAGRRNPSLPGSPSRDRASETPILAALGGTPGKRYSAAQAAVSPGAPDRYDYHSAQLERFLEEYRSLHSELSKMKETCDSLSANPKSILKKKATPAGQAGGGAHVGALSPEHPYWVPRSGLAGLARRYSGGDFYPS